MSNRREQSDRRGQAERRNLERRRGQDPRRPVLEICRSMLHLALVIDDGPNRPKKVVTRSIRWRKESESIHTDLGAAELQDAVRQMVAEEKLVGAKLRVALNGELCVTRVISGAADQVRHEFADLEERSQLYLSLGPGQKAIARSIKQTDARHQHGVFTVANQKTLDVLVDVAESVGVQIDAIEPSLVALARAQGQIDEADGVACIVIQVDERAAELGVCQEGELLLEYRPGGRVAAANLPTVVGEHLSRLERYLARKHGYSGGKLTKVWLTGEPGPVELARRKFAELNDLTVKVLSPQQFAQSFEYAEEEPSTEFAAAMGSALVQLLDDAESQGPNLMEHQIARTRSPLKPFLLRSAMPLVAVLLIAAGIGVLNFQVSMERSELQAKLDALAPSQMRSKELRLKLASADAKIQELSNIDAKIWNPDWSQIIARVGHSLPDDVWLDQFVVEGSETGSLSGASYADSGVYDFLGYLEQMPDLDRVALSGTGLANSAAGPTTSFDVEFSLALNSGANDGEGRND